MKRVPEYTTATNVDAAQLLYLLTTNVFDPQISPNHPAAETAMQRYCHDDIRHPKDNKGTMVKTAAETTAGNHVWEWPRLTALDGQDYRIRSARAPAARDPVPIDLRFPLAVNLRNVIQASSRAWFNQHDVRSDSVIKST